MNAMVPVQPGNAGMTAVEEAEQRRVAAVRATGLMDTDREMGFDQLVELAAELCGTPIGLVSLIGRHRQYFKASVGLPMRELSRKASPCEVTVAAGELVVVEDMQADERFRRNPLVTGEPRLRFYAGVPLMSPDGLVLGTMCVADTIPRGLRDAERRALVVLSDQVRVRLELQLEHQKLAEALRDRKRVIAELRSIELRFRKFMNHAPFVSFIKDAEGRFVFYNRRMAEQFQISMDAWIGKDDFDLWPKEMAERFRETDVEVMTSGKMLVRSEETKDSRGKVMCWKSYKFPLRNEMGETWLGGLALDMSVENEQRKRLEEANQKLERLATTDALTGLSNRRVLDERLEYEFKYAVRHRMPLSVVMLDVDNFKKLNDTHGHAAGDLVLKKLGGLVTATVRATDLGARYGGEEMAVLLPGATTDGAVLFVERLRDAMRLASWPNGKVTASFGVGEITAATKTGDPADGACGRCDVCGETGGEGSCGV